MENLAEEVEEIFARRPHISADHAARQAPAITITVYGTPGPQGSKHATLHKQSRRVVTMESSKKVKPWRQDVKQAALEAMGKGEPLDGPLAVEMVFTLRDKPASRPTWWPTSARWSRLLWWRPAGAPDLSKLIRSTEDALTEARAWRDDARVVEYRRAAKVFVGQPGEPDALRAPGAVIRVWPLPVEAVSR
ncbi:RusA family crossover junction endodeoxyribonuclease [Sphaerisporangium album]|uniref:RusA family crossover junction endodeoxyribonuclease n=2 Tax=Sphaerisporangium album TaxID=509200 RepID=A0A367FCH3_9ACTN|nr:RusA family crossover junction endodeoxyribonuclease [Sphaerisporangium album]